MIDTLIAATHAAINGSDGTPDSRLALTRAVHAERMHVAGRIERLEQTRRLAQQVREAQRRYFASRDRGVLAESRRLERELDALLDPAPMLPGMEASR